MFNRKVNDIDIKKPAIYLALNNDYRALWEYGG